MRELERLDPHPRIAILTPFEVNVERLAFVLFDRLMDMYEKESRYLRRVAVPYVER